MGVKSKLPPQESDIQSYLLVIDVWERQDGANTALKTHTEEEYSYHRIEFFKKFFILFFFLFLSRKQVEREGE